jgi:hypothetical protein
MRSQQGKVSFYSLLEGAAIAAFCGLVYYAVFLLQAKLSPFVNFTQGVDLFFAPAGVKLIAFMVAGIWGFWGIAVFGLITAFDVWQAETLLIQTGNILIWAGVPYVTYRWIANFLDIDRALGNLKYRHVVVIAFVTTLTSSFGSNLYQYMINNRSFDMITGASIAMAIGDFIGSGVCVFALAFVVKRLLR